MASSILLRISSGSSSLHVALSFNTKMLTNIPHFHAYTKHKPPKLSNKPKCCFSLNGQTLPLEPPAHSSHFRHLRHFMDSFVAKFQNLLIFWFLRGLSFFFFTHYFVCFFSVFSYFLRYTDFENKKCFGVFHFFMFFFFFEVKKLFKLCT